MHRSTVDEPHRAPPPVSPEPPSATVPISLVKAFLAGAQARPETMGRYLEEAGVAPELLAEPGARVTEE